jgi:hypothetical protein
LREVALAEAEYKVVETSVVTDEELEQILNRVSAEGWTLDAIQFAMRDGNRRPSMAFVIFTRARREDEAR